MKEKMEHRSFALIIALALFCSVFGIRKISNMNNNHDGDHRNYQHDNSSNRRSMGDSSTDCNGAIRIDGINEGKADLAHVTIPLISTTNALPNFENGAAGGVVLFYHVAKTGGTPIRTLFQNLARKDDSLGGGNFRYMRYMNPPSPNNHAMPMKVEADGCNPKPSLTEHCIPNEDKNRLPMFDAIITDLLTNRKIKNKENRKNSPKQEKETLLLEIHGGSPGLKDLSRYITKWRSHSQSNDNFRPFFAFTIVRDPTAHVMSYFNFYYSTRCDFQWCEREPNGHTLIPREDTMNEKKEQLLKTARQSPNRQCFLLNHASNVEGMHSSFYNKCSVNEEDCNHIYSNIMRSTLDWVGTAENMSSELIPLLSYVLQRPHNYDEKREELDLIRVGSEDGEDNPLHLPIHEEKQDNDGPMGKFFHAAALECESGNDKLSSIPVSTKRELHDLSKYDQILYNRVKRDYSLKKIYPEVIVVYKRRREN